MYMESEVQNVDYGILHRVMESEFQNIVEFLLMESKSLHSLEQNTTINVNLALPHTTINICAK